MSNADKAVKISEEVNLLMTEGAKAILAGTVEGVPGEMHGHPILTYDIGVSRFFCDRQIFCGEK